MLPSVLVRKAGDGRMPCQSSEGQGRRTGRRMEKRPNECNWDQLCRLVTWSLDDDDHEDHADDVPADD